jgi:hypothetical protein
MSDKISLEAALGTRRVVELDFGPRVSRDELIESLDKILHMSGCTACGLQGIDINFKSRTRLKEIIEAPNLLDARIIERQR